MSQTLCILRASHAIIVRPADRGGFAVYEHKYREEAPVLHACVADDEGLLEWFAEQVQAERPDIGQLAAEHTTAILQVADIHKALKPFVDLAIVRRQDDDQTMVDCTQGDGSEWAEVRLGQLRALLKAAGLFTDEMLPPPVAPGADAEQAGDTAAPPAEPPLPPPPPPPPPPLEDFDPSF